MGELPAYVKPVFELTVLATLLLFYIASNRSRPVLLILLAWVAIQGFLSFSGFYSITDAMPPRPFFLIVIPFALIVLLFVTTWGRNFIYSLDLKTLTLLHVVRIPVELVLFWLFLQKGIPEMMTYEGSNFDIFSGLTAPFIFYFGFVNRKLNRNMLLLWNFVCLGLLINIVMIAILSIPSPFQKLAFDQPNNAVLTFPFTWLPALIVPLVLFSHLVAIRQLMSGRPFR